MRAAQRDDLIPKAALVRVDERPGGALREDLARAVLGELRRVAALLLDLLHGARGPVVCGVGVRHRLGGLAHRAAGGRDRDALDGGAVLKRALEDTDGACDGGADVFFRFISVEVTGGGEVCDSINAFHCLVEDTLLDGKSSVGSVRVHLQSEQTDHYKPYQYRQ